MLCGGSAPLGTRNDVRIAGTAQVCDVEPQWGVSGPACRDLLAGVGRTTRCAWARRRSWMRSALTHSGIQCLCPAAWAEGRRDTSECGTLACMHARMYMRTRAVVPAARLSPTQRLTATLYPYVACARAPPCSGEPSAGSSTCQGRARKPCPCPWSASSKRWSPMSSPRSSSGTASRCAHAHARTHTNAPRGQACTHNVRTSTPACSAHGCT